MKQITVCIQLLGVMVATSLASPYTVIDLGSLGGEMPLRARAINNSDQVVGIAEFLGATHPFLWKNGAITDMGIFVSSTTYANDINDAGQVVGSGMERAFIWEDGQYTDLGNLGGSWTGATARGLNDAGQVVGSSWYYSGDHYYGVLWEDGEITNIGGWDGCPQAINEGGLAIGWYRHSTGGGLPYVQHAATWEGTTKTDLGTLGSEELHSWGYDINDSGEKVGFSETDNGPIHAFLSGSGMQDLGTLPGGDWSKAYAINNSTKVLGEAGTAGGDTHAVLWQGGAMYDLNELIPPGSGWELISARDINDQGHIVGEGINPDGKTRGFLLIPEPATLSPLAFGGLALIRRRSH